MAKNEFLPFGIAEGANVLSNQEYERLAARFNGFISGVAKSKELNTVWRQSSVMSSALAQFIVDSDNKDLLDNGDVASIKTRLVAAIKQTISGVGYVTTAAMNLELNKKIDKESISGVLGNDNSKVPSLNLLSTELGKKQPKGDYAPAGDYATNAALNNGLASKLDKTGGTVSGQLTVARSGDAVHIKPTSEGGNSYFQIDEFNGTRASFIGFGGSSTDKTLTVRNDKLKTSFQIVENAVMVNGTKVMLVGDYGFGGYMHGLEYLTESQVANKFKAAVTQVWRNQQETTKYAARYGASLYVRSSDAFWNMNVNHASGDVLISNGLTGQDPSTFKIAKLFSTLNTTSDRNGHLKITNVSTELSDYPIGSPIPWPQATAPTGYLICNGQQFNKTMWPLLAKAYPSGVLPDLRSEFIRGLDAGRNVDSGRAVLSVQGDAIRDITGEIQGINLSGNGAFISGGVVAYGMSPNGSGKDQMKLSFKASNVVPTANENRPRNIAFLYIVRAA
ncbi:phage tail protein [Providencia manganoxydans]|uniref:phage tail protein n=1 Tax=Providencia manganoxydans TaxID=2923283 RepID=UPI0032DACCFF